MKKNKLIAGIIIVMLGLASLSVVLLFDTKLEGLLCGFAGACLVPGILQLHKYFYWNSSMNKERYQEILEHEKIEMQDELKTKVRDKAGRLVYTIGLYVSSIAVILFALLNALDVIDDNAAHLIILYLGGYLVIQLIIHKLIYNRIIKQYE